MKESRDKLYIKTEVIESIEKGPRTIQIVGHVLEDNEEDETVTVELYVNGKKEIRQFTTRNNRSISFTPHLMSFE